MIMMLIKIVANKKMREKSLQTNKRKAVKGGKSKQAEDRKATKSRSKT